VQAGSFECGLEAAIAVVGGKWKPMILWGTECSTAPLRCPASRTARDHEKVLTQQLRELEHDGIVHREVHDQVPPRVEYSLTPLGESLDRALAPLGDWGERHLDHIAALRPEPRVTARR
jgi:DNA-binding HxlR family transcriptional regulator